MSASFPQECIAAFLAEAQFYGLQELHQKLTQHQLCRHSKFEYKYVRVSSGDSARCYAPQTCDEIVWGFTQPIVLKNLHTEGWEYVQSIPCTKSEKFIVVLRRQQRSGRVADEQFGSGSVV